jgi:hypothetical protein
MTDIWTTKPETPKYYAKLDDYASEKDQAAAIYATRTMTIVAWMDLPTAGTMWDYARDLCAKQGNNNPSRGLLRRIVELAAKDY